MSDEELEALRRQEGPPSQPESKNESSLAIFGTPTEANIAVSPYQYGGKLFFKGSDGLTYVGSAQFVGEYNIILTAAHCVCDDVGSTCQPGGAFEPDPAAFSVFLQNAGVFAVQSIHVEPSFDFPVGDVAVLKLAAPVVGIRPTPILTGSAPPNGTIGTIAGFGRAGGTASDYGLKRSGEVDLASCTNGISNTTSVCWDFVAPIGPAGTDSNTCNADSGGPLLVDLGAGPRLAGTTSGGFSGSCNAPDHSYDANVAHYAAFIQAQGGADLDNEICGARPQVGDPAAAVTAIQSTLPATAGSRVHAIVVPPGAKALRVALNADESGGNDFDLWLRAASKPTANAYTCRSTGAGQYAYCEIDHPAGTTWWARVKRNSGSGAYQLTATVLHRLTPVVSDFDGDGRADVAVVDSQTGAWSAIGSTAGPGISFDLGVPGKRFVPGDYDGDGVADVAVYQAATATWTIRLSSTGTTTTATLGGKRLLPAAGDYDGDGKTDVAVYSRKTGVWTVLGSNSGFQTYADVGGATMVPVPADVDGDGVTDRVVYDTLAGGFTVRSQISGTWFVSGLGGPGFEPVGGDFDGDGVRDLGVFANGAFDYRASSTGQIVHVVVGVAGDLPAPADYDGDGITDLAVFDVTANGLKLMECAPGITLDELKEKTGVPFAA